MPTMVLEITRGYEIDTETFDNLCGVRVKSWSPHSIDSKHLLIFTFIGFCPFHRISKKESLRNICDIWKPPSLLCHFFPCQEYIYDCATTLSAARRHVASLSANWSCQFIEGFPVCWCRTGHESRSSREPRWAPLISAACLVRRRANGTFGKTHSQGFRKGNSVM